ncbi:hypothetical protein HZA98_01625 [Candidatus Woesearchaeota archaeon]|nr:hypothetical protein [Candidatus Woesearchaeota archaeon]
MKVFEEFLKEGIVTKQSSNRARALSLLEEAQEKKAFLEIALEKIPKEKISPNFIIDSSYDILIEIIRGKMLLDGYASKSSHEAEVSYLTILQFSEPELRFMNELRYNRNGIKYYGTIFNKEYADKVLAFLKKLYPSLKGMIF